MEEQLPSALEHDCPPLDHPVSLRLRGCPRTAGVESSVSSDVLVALGGLCLAFPGYVHGETSTESPTRGYATLSCWSNNESEPHIDISVG